MKKMMNKTIIIVTVLAVFFALAGCSDLTKKDDADTEKNVLSCTVSGKVTVQNALPSEIVSSLIKNSDSSRSATASSFDNAHTCLVRIPFRQYRHNKYVLECEFESRGKLGD